MKTRSGRDGMQSMKNNSRKICQHFIIKNDSGEGQLSSRAEEVASQKGQNECTVMQNVKDRREHRRVTFLGAK